MYLDGLIKKHREDKKLSKEAVCRKLQLYGIYLHRTELYRKEIGESIIKDFELIALCEILDIDYEKEVKILID